MKSSDIKFLSNSVLEILVKASDKFVKKNHTDPHVLSALQIATHNFLGSVIMANARILDDKSQQLDFIDRVECDVHSVLEQVRAMIKSVDLH
jgi:hypothetical protein